MEGIELGIELKTGCRAHPKDFMVNQRIVPISSPVTEMQIWA